MGSHSWVITIENPVTRHLSEAPRCYAWIRPSEKWVLDLERNNHPSIELEDVLLAALIQDDIGFGRGLGGVWRRTTSTCGYSSIPFKAAPSLRMRAEM